MKKWWEWIFTMCSHDATKISHALENNHHIVFDEARLIDRATNYWDRPRREAIEIKLQPSNFNRDSGLHISKSWDPAISTLRRLWPRGQHSTSAPVLTTPGIDQCTRCGERPLWLDSSRNTHRSINELIATIGKSTAYISRVFSYCTHSSEEGHIALIWSKAEVLITSLGRLPGKIFWIINAEKVSSLIKISHVRILRMCFRKPLILSFLYLLLKFCWFLPSLSYKLL